ncbi:RagB/SusD family nutrient uptake outer membrane protein [Fulvivirgaceae bacterium BMA10]|uniref:RagB/SusD family nutrient uptake outer membrane protein n=1 Tax=Splendidivirga corallicola TaxID=3051826 RepID=A0ABT8KQZ0_9BACT|nr:RagB/SusD family nutrient uptake outer membrane protein [Fulvivirgaceae bacterium BMA10]
MKNILYKINILVLALVISVVTGCEDLDTQNLNNPDTQQVLATGNDLPGFLAGGFVTWWQANHQSRPGLTLGVASDAVSCSWGNFGMRRMSEEPRDPYNNSSAETTDYKDVVRFPWFRNLSAQFTANNVIKSLNDGLTLGDASQDKMLETSAFFLRGIARGYLGLLFDQAYLTDENTDLSQQLDFTTYQEMIAGAVSDLEQAASLANANTFTMDPSFISGLSMTNTQLAALANSYAARFLAQSARTAAENDAADWAKVLSFAENGITADFAPLADGTNWFGYWRYSHIGNGGPTGSWARLDQRLVSALDPSQPSRFPQDGNGLANPTATSADSRLASDFTFVETQNFRPERGLWHFSHYKHSRNLSEPEYMGDGVSAGPMPAFTTTDNELLRAEALYRLGREADAAAVVNAGTRVTRGNLPAVATSGAEILEAILYERFIETLNTGPAGHFFDRRRIGDRVAFDNLDALGGLQMGTPGHLPVPAEELEVFELEPYNFGGANDPTGLVRQ